MLALWQDLTITLLSEAVPLRRVDSYHLECVINHDSRISMRKQTVTELCQGLAPAMWDKNLQFKEPVLVQKWVILLNRTAALAVQSAVLPNCCGSRFAARLFKCFLHRYLHQERSWNYSLLPENGGSQIMLRSRTAHVYFVSPSQIEAYLPSNRDSSHCYHKRWQRETSYKTI